MHSHTSHNALVAEHYFFPCPTSNLLQSSAVLQHLLGPGRPGTDPRDRTGQRPDDPGGEAEPQVTRRHLEPSHPESGRLGSPRRPGSALSCLLFLQRQARMRQGHLPTKVL